MAYTRSRRKSARRPAYRSGGRGAPRRAVRAKRSGPSRAASTVRIVIENPGVASGPTALGPFQKVTTTRKAQF